MSDASEENQRMAPIAEDGRRVSGRFEDIQRLTARGD
jgi:hypothetical protein